jgi:CheY-like chemotaxis protein
VSATILVVDDEPDVEALFRQQFRREIRDGRFKIDFARSGNEALRLIEALAGTTLVLILSDINMPGMSGLNLLPKVRAARPDVPVIMITAYGDTETRRTVLEAGAEALFTKPIDFPALRNDIEARVRNVGLIISNEDIGRCNH